jgi:hypothetical protein
VTEKISGTPCTVIAYIQKKVGTKKVVKLEILNKKVGENDPIHDGI